MPNLTKYSLDHVSIHAPRVGCDKLAPDLLGAIAVFQFTHPVWGATVESYVVYAR